MTHAELIATARNNTDPDLAEGLAFQAGNLAEEERIRECPFLKSLTAAQDVRLFDAWHRGYAIAVKGREERMVREQKEVEERPKYWWTED